MFQQSLSSGQNCRLLPLMTNFGKNHCRFIAGDLKAFFLFFFFDFLHIDPSNDFCFCKFFPKVSKVKEKG
jgi:hypothetical protein